MRSDTLFHSFTQPSGASGVIYGAEWSTTLLLAAVREDGRFAECLRLIAAHPKFANHTEGGIATPVLYVQMAIRGNFAFLPGTPNDQTSALKRAEVSRIVP